MTTTHCLDDLLKYPRGWNGCNATTPNPLSVAHAKAWIAQFQQEHSSDWIEPATTADAWGDVCLEWRHNGKHLCIFVGANSTIEYLTSWKGCSIDEMKTGEANTADEQAALWVWLTAE